MSLYLCKEVLIYVNILTTCTYRPIVRHFSLTGCGGSRPDERSVSVSDQSERSLYRRQRQSIVPRPSDVLEAALHAYRSYQLSRPACLHSDPTYQSSLFYFAEIRLVFSD